MKSLITLIVILTFSSASFAQKPVKTTQSTPKVAKTIRIKQLIDWKKEYKRMEILGIARKTINC